MESIIQTTGEKIIKIICNQKLKLYIGISDTGRLILFRSIRTRVWIYRLKELKFYDACWHPNSTLICAFYHHSNKNYFKIIQVECCEDIFTKELEEKILWIHWFYLDYTLYPSNNILKIKNDDISIHPKSDKFTTIIFNDILTLLCTAFQQKITLFLQGITPIITIPQSAEFCFIPPTFSSIFLFCASGKINTYDTTKITQTLIDTFFISILIYQIKLLFSTLSDCFEFLGQNYTKKLNPLIKLLKNSYNLEDLTKDFIQAFYFGIVSIELTHLLAEKANETLLNTSILSTSDVQTYKQEIIKSQIIIEKIMSLCQSIETLLISNPYGSELLEFKILQNNLEKAYNWTFLTFNEICLCKSLELWRVFPTWLVYLMEFTCRDTSRTKVFEKIAFNGLSDIGNDKEIRKILIDFLLNNFNKIFDDNNYHLDVIPFSLNSLSESILSFSECFPKYLSRNFNDVNLKIIDFYSMKSPKIYQIQNENYLSGCSCDNTKLFVFSFIKDNDNLTIKCIPIHMGRSALYENSTFLENGNFMLVCKTNKNQIKLARFKKLSFLTFEKAKELNRFETIQYSEDLKINSDYIFIDFSIPDNFLFIGRNNNTITTIDLENPLLLY